jgi:hypothetical protein
MDINATTAAQMSMAAGLVVRWAPIGVLWKLPRSLNRCCCLLSTLLLVSD